MLMTRHKFRDQADKLEDEIKALIADRRENTPKQQQQAAYARLQGIHLQRTQKALYVLAEIHESGGHLCDEVLKFNSKKAVHEAMRSKMERGAGYYSVPADLGIPASDDPAVLELWELIDDGNGCGREQEELRRKIAELKFAKIPGYFPTPEPVIALMLRYAELERGHIVLEPSAGSGAIMDAVKGLCHAVEGLEINHTLADILKRKGHTVAQADFMDWRYLDQNYDRVLMNPPFERLQDIDHVIRAFSLALKPGGRLVSVMSAGAFFNTNGKAQGFRHWTGELGATVVDLPEGSFKESGTGVASKLIVIDKPY